MDRRASLDLGLAEVGERAAYQRRGIGEPEVGFRQLELSAAPQIDLGVGV